MNTKDESEALICERHCGYEEALTMVPKWLDFSVITKDTISERETLSRFMHWLHFEKGVHLARFNNGKINIDELAWSCYFDEYLGIKNLFTDLNKPMSLCEKCATHKVLSYIWSGVHDSQPETKEELS